jgi:hypothetical protein
LTDKHFDGAAQGDSNDTVWLSGRALKGYGLIGLLLFLTVVGMVLAHFQYEKNVWFLELKTTEGLDHWGQIGDFVGGILNPIFSFAAFAMLLFTFNKQIADGKKADRENKKLLDNRRFFELMSLMHEVAKGVEVDDTVTTYTNHRAIGRAWNICRRTTGKSLANTPEELWHLSLITDYRAWRKKYWPSVGNYFDLAFFVIEKYIMIQSDESDYFLSALQAQMSTNERNILYLEMLNSARLHGFIGHMDERDFWLDTASGLEPVKHVLNEQAKVFFARKDAPHQPGNDPD